MTVALLFNSRITQEIIIKFYFIIDCATFSIVKMRPNTPLENALSICPFAHNVLAVLTDTLFECALLPGTLHQKWYETRCVPHCVFMFASNERTNERTERCKEESRMEEWKKNKKFNNIMLICLYQECAVMMWLRRHCANKLDEHCLVGIVRSDRHNVGLLFRYLEKGYASIFRMPGKSRTNYQNIGFD